MKHIDACGAKTEIRIPFVPNYNDGEIDLIAKFLLSLNNITGVRVIPYHNCVVTKYESIDKSYLLPNKLPTHEELYKAENTIRHYGINIVKA